MGRRSDHSRDELRELIVGAGHGLLAETGFARFSAREVAKRIGYTVGTLYNVFGSLDAMLVAINTRTFVIWTDWMHAALADTSDDRIAALVQGYFSFARAHQQLWTAIYDHHLPPGTSLPAEDEVLRGKLTEIIVREVATALGRAPDHQVNTLARSLVATVHGHCVFMVSGAWALMGEDAPEAVALARVRESLAAAHGA
jgi:AcrR family transcriptional regulator